MEITIMGYIGFRVEELEDLQVLRFWGFRVWCWGFRVWDLGFRVWGFRVWGFGFA